MMKAVLQRVAEARVVVGGDTRGRIGQGILMLMCAECGDGSAQADKLLAKTVKLRIFSDGPGAGSTPAMPASSGLQSVQARLRGLGQTADASPLEAWRLARAARYTK